MVTDFAEARAWLLRTPHIQSSKQGLTAAATAALAPLLSDAIAFATDPSNVSDKQAWTPLILFAKLMTAPFPDGASKPVITAILKERVRLWDAADIPTLRKKAEAAARDMRSARRVSTNRYQRAELAATLVAAGEISKAAKLAQSNGILEDPAEAHAALIALHPPRLRMEDVGLPTEPDIAPKRDAATLITQEALLKAINTAPTRSAPGIDSLRYEHFKVLALSHNGAANILGLARRIARGDVPPDVADLLATSRLVAFSKDTLAATNAARAKARANDAPFIPAVRPIGIGLTITRLTTAALLESHIDAIVDAISPDLQHGFRNKAGAELIQHAIRIGMQASGNAGCLQLDLKNAFNTVSRERIYQILTDTPSLHFLRPIYRLLYLDRQPALLFYDGDHLFATLQSAEGVRQGCVLGMALFCVAFAPHLQRVAALGGLPFGYADDCNILCTPDQATRILQILPADMARSGLVLNDAKVKYLPPPDITVPEDYFDDFYAAYEHDTDVTCSRRAQIVSGLKILGGPYGASTHVASVLADRSAEHGRLTTLISEIAETGQRHAAIRLIQTAACRRHQHLARALDPEAAHPLLQQTDTANEVTMLSVLDVDTTVNEPAAQENTDVLRERLYLSTDFGGYNLTRLAEERHVAHYASLAATLHPLHDLMLRHAPNRFADNIRLAIAHPDPTLPWAATAFTAYYAAVQATNVPPDIIERAHRASPHPRPAVKAGQPNSRVDSASGYKQLKIPHPSELHISTTRHLQARLGPALRIRRFAAAEARLINTNNEAALVRLYGAAAGGATHAVADDPRIYQAPPAIQLTLHRQALGLISLPASATDASDGTSCPNCKIPSARTQGIPPYYTPDHALTDHIPRCRPADITETHNAIVATIRDIALQGLGHPKHKLTTEEQGLRGDLTRPADLSLKDYDGPGRHLYIDVTVSSAFTSTNYTHSKKPGNLCSTAENRKFTADKRSAKPIQNQHRLVPFAVEATGRLGEHAKALLREWHSRLIHTRGSTKTQNNQVNLYQIWAQQVVVTLRLSLARALIQA